MSSSSSDVYIALSAMAEMIKYDLSISGKETAGLLIGEEINGEVHVDEIRVGKQKGNAVHVEISEEELAMAAIEVRDREDDKVIVGWFHTHPGLSSFMSGTDINTQRMYQALMPNAIAIVIDDVKYSKSGSINDLDFGVYRVVGDKPQRIEYHIKNSVEFGLNSYVLSDSDYISPSSRPALRTKYYVPTMNQEKINSLKDDLENKKESLDPVDVESLKLWIELAESIENESVKEVPIDAKTLMGALDASISEINYELKEIKDQAYNRQAQTTMFFIILGIFIELFAFYSLS
jgi:proteasome lid subunit RPN8/RPN11